jgi:hypothetical protein
MRRSTILSLVVLALPASLAAQYVGTQHGDRGSLGIAALSEPRRLNLLPSEVVGFRVTGEASVGRILRVSAGHLVSGRLYYAVAMVTPRDGSAPIRAEGTLSADAPRLPLGTLPAGAYTIRVHLEDVATGATRDATNKVVLE